MKSVCSGGDMGICHLHHDLRHFPFLGVIKIMYLVHAISDSMEKVEENV